MAPLSHELVSLSGGQFRPVCHGQFQPVKGGQFKSVEGCQFHRILQAVIDYQHHDIVRSYVKPLRFYFVILCIAGKFFKFLLKKNNPQACRLCFPFHL